MVYNCTHRSCETCELYLDKEAVQSIQTPQTSDLGSLPISPETPKGICTFQMLLLMYILYTGVGLYTSLEALHLVTNFSSRFVTLYCSMCQMYCSHQADALGSHLSALSTVLSAEPARNSTTCMPWSLLTFGPVGVKC